jgi:hypothetical protein
MTTHEATSVPEAVEAAAYIASQWETASRAPDLWYRGVADNSFDLIPHAYRLKGYEETQVLLDFHQNACAYAETDGMNDWDLYFLAQHHSVPTRLLDWTENFLAAVYFAIRSCEGDSTPCVWVINPARLNLALIGWEGLIVPTNSEKDSIWLPSQAGTPKTSKGDDGFEYSNKSPLAIWPRRSNRRIVAQQGAFTVHGVEREPINNLIDESKHPQTIARIDIKFADSGGSKSILRSLGMKHAAFFPDLDNYVMDLKEHHGW